MEKLLPDAALIEAAYILRNDDIINELLDLRYFQIAKSDRKSSKFFLLNNILRDRVIESLDDMRLRQFLSDAELNLTETGVSVKFRDDIYSKSETRFK